MTIVSWENQTIYDIVEEHLLRAKAEGLIRVSDANIVDIASLIAEDAEEALYQDRDPVSDPPPPPPSDMDEIRDFCGL